MWSQVLIHSRFHHLRNLDLDWTVIQVRILNGLRTGNFGSPVSLFAPYRFLRYDSPPSSLHLGSPRSEATVGSVAWAEWKGWRWGEETERPSDKDWLHPAYLHSEAKQWGTQSPWHSLLTSPCHPRLGLCPGFASRSEGNEWFIFY